MRLLSIILSLWIILLSLYPCCPSVLLRIVGIFSSLWVNDIIFCISHRVVPHSSVGHLGCFDAWAIVITALMNVGVQVSSKTVISFFSIYCQHCNCCII